MSPKYVDQQQHTAQQVRQAFLGLLDKEIERKQAKPFPKALHNRIQAIRAKAANVRR